MATVIFEPLPRDLAEIQRQIEGYARGHGLDFFPTDLRGGRCRSAQRGRGLRRLSDSLSALAVRHGIRAARQGLHYGLQKIYELVINNDPVLRLPDEVATR